ncbi:MDR family MFS transporter [Evansella cellulosilytica]|uniref:Drug resistance transporter, EmrB/QacA subfamily n=1 Tax=Evansella cellulosilytica (strain ATCC 21833 / DSM 2522 / FERM P-1141 / JCM 9156 / N-4) TaxID=649639 RepID=E6TQJ8_EVAC2|nr:MDR family MFS transporter [Evansella cellulosilytica]ADU30509.1 drug resistance transporter, EmrB/QacA subfamily [Evansella cellulosilytica DSM 2522]
MSSTYNKKLITTLLLAGSFIAILNQTLMITAIPPIMNEMNISPNSAQWLTTVFMLVSGIMIPISAFFIEKFTTRQLFIAAMGIFSVGTIVCALAPNFGTLIAGRIIQSAGAGVMLPLMQTVFLLVYPRNKRGAAMGLVGLVISFAPAIGPALSGFIMIHFSWRVLFYIILPIALLSIVISIFKLQNVTDLKNPKVDILSVIFSSFGFGGLLYGFTAVGNYGWSNWLTIMSLSIGIITLCLFIFRQFVLENPMLEFRVFKYKIFTLTTILGMIVFMGLIGSETLIPLYMQDMRSFTPFEAGLAILPGALVSGFMSPITGKIFDKVGARWLSIIGLAIIMVTTIPFSFLNEVTSFAYITIFFAIRMFGLSMVMMPTTTAGLNELPNHLIPHGTAMTNTMRQVAASIGTAILVTVMTTTSHVATNVSNPDIHGVNVAFMVITITSLIGLIIACFVTNPAHDHHEEDTEITISIEKNPQ